MMANKKCLLPKGSQRIQKLGYEEVYVPAVRHKRAEGDKLVQISELPEWARAAFPSYVEHLNEI
jgi:pre-mRNA-splicing helicase BRR2